MGLPEMERTQRLLSIALAVLALDGCRGPSQHAQAVGATGTPSSSHGSSSHYYSGGHFGTGAAIGGAAAGAAAQRNGNGTVDRTLGGNRGRMGGGFGQAGAHGGGG